MVSLEWPALAKCRGDRPLGGVLVLWGFRAVRGVLDLCTIRPQCSFVDYQHFSPDKPPADKQSLETGKARRLLPAVLTLLLLIV